mmetsp:Transcript_76540/g.234301  ORF Transcript_76540/g.234301 Transcript_76540/m.234301 type:complete len:375 (-) Transcript_76540:1371-2495(-)
MCKPRGVLMMSLTSYALSPKSAASNWGMPHDPRLTQPKSPALWPGCMAVSHSECFLAKTWKMLGFSNKDRCMANNSRSACACVRETRGLPFKRTWDSGSLAIRKSLCLSSMCKHLTLSTACSARAFFVGGSSALSSWTSKPATTALARQAAGGACRLDMASDAVCAMTSEAVLGCRGKPRNRDTTSSSDNARVARLSKARWYEPGVSIGKTSICGSDVTIALGRFKSRRPNALETMTASNPMPSFGAGACKASKASSSIAAARAASGCAKRPSAKTPSFCKVFLHSSAFCSASSNCAPSSRPSKLRAQDRGMTAESTSPASSSNLWSSIVAFASASYMASILSKAASTLAKASLACSLRSPGALSGCTFKANFL